MGNLMVAVLGVQGYSAAFAKKGTSTDITLYNLKKGEDTVTLVEPTRYPERLAPLFYAASEAKKAVVVVDELNATLGESLVMLQCCGVSSGYFILRNSWGKGWGRGGYAHVTDGYALAAFEDAYGVVV